MTRPPTSLSSLSDDMLALGINKTERLLKAEIERVSGADVRFKRVLADAMRVEDEVERRAK